MREHKTGTWRDMFLRSDEYISKADAQSAWGNIRLTVDEFEQLADAIDSVPPADVVPVRKGTWIEEESLWDDRYWTCSVCRESWCLTDDGTPEDHDMRYCPHCGAKMEDKNA